MKKVFAIIGIGIFLLANLALSQEKVGGGLKKRVAVMDFEDKTGHGAWHIGSGMADMLTTALVKSGRFVVIEREQLKKVMQEQALGMTGAVTAGTAAQVARLLGVELIITGSVNEFGEKESHIGGGMGRRLGGLGGVGVETKTARVGLDVRLVNSSTAEIVTAEGITEEESKKGVDIAHDDFVFSTGANFDNTLAGKATRKAVNKCVEVIAKGMDKIPWAGRIIKDNGDGTFIIRPGLDGGVKSGDTFVVYSLGEKIVDPTTGEELGAQETKAGKIQVTSVQEKISIGKAIEGKGFKPGDAVKLQ